MKRARARAKNFYNSLARKTTWVTLLSPTIYRCNMMLRNGLRELHSYKLQTSRLHSRSVIRSYGAATRSFSSTAYNCEPAPSSTRSSHNDRRAEYWMLPSAFVAAAGLALLLTHSTPLRLEAPQDAETDPSKYRLDPSTSQPFPITLPTPATPLPSSCKELQLVGLGVRTVSFLRVKVYVAGLYIDSNARSRLKVMDGWKGFESAWMMDSKEEHSGEKLVAALLDQGITCAIRIGESLDWRSCLYNDTYNTCYRNTVSIVPVRSTDFGHLRDGFTVSIDSHDSHELFRSIIRLPPIESHPRSSQIGTKTVSNQ